MSDEEYEREQYELELYRQQCEEQEREHQWEEHCNYCLGIANDWLLGECSFSEADEYIYATGDKNGLFHWAEYIVDNVKLADEE